MPVVEYIVVLTKVRIMLKKMALWGERPSNLIGIGPMTKIKAYQILASILATYLYLALLILKPHFLQ